MNFLIFAAGMAVVGVSSWLLTRYFIAFAVKRRILDVPNERSSHTVARPRGGGVAFVLVFTLAVFILWAMHVLPGRDALALACGIPVAAIGFWDDMAGLSWKLRLIVHIAAAMLALSCFEHFTQVRLDFAVSFSPVAIAAAVVCGLVWLTNLTNFMDGIDGIAGVEVIVTSAACFLLIAHNSGLNGIAMAFAAMAVAVAGFLVWNWPPAKIYMGDAGSSFLGFTLGVMVCIAVAKHGVSIWSPLILFSVFLVDATWTLLRRMLRAEQWYTPHRSHAYQHAAGRWGHRATTLVVAAIDIFWLAPLAWLANVRPSHGPLLFVIAAAPLIAIVYALRAGENLSTKEKVRLQSASLQTEASIDAI